MFWQFSSSSGHDNPDFFRDAFLRVVSDEVTVIGVGSAAST